MQKNGNISEIHYQTIGREKESWQYTYDYLDRLKTANHTKQTSSGALAIGQYSENITYDGPRGNITGIKRFGTIALPTSSPFTTLQSGMIG